MDVKYMEITPEMAGEWLLTSNGNPRWRTGKVVDKSKVARIENDIKRGKWNPGNNSIAFDVNGNLVDGHHRLAAIKDSGISVWSIVAFGIEESGAQHIDENNVRKIWQRIGTDSQIVASANYHFWSLNKSCSISQTSETVSEWLKNHPAVYVAKDACTKGSNHAIAKNPLQSTRQCVRWSVGLTKICCSGL